MAMGMLAFLGSFVGLAVVWSLGFREGWLAGTAEPPLPATDDAEVARMFGMELPEERPWAPPNHPFMP